MKNLKIGILVFGALGLISLFMELEVLKAGYHHDKFNTVLVIAGFAAPLLMGFMGQTKPPFLPWQATVSLAGFVVCAIRLRVWQLLQHVTDLPTSFKLTVAAIVGGLIVSIIAVAKPEAVK